MMNSLRLWWMRRGLMLMSVSLALGACTATRTVPGPAIEVKVPVPVPCKPVEVTPPARPKAEKGMGIFDLTKVALADRRVLMADTTRLRAANANPCPGDANAEPR